MTARLREGVRRRAGFRGEYCQFPERHAELRFQLDHIISEQHRGPTVPGNLAWSCLRCNKHKGPNLSGVESGSGQIVRLYNPRADDWPAHFAWAGPLLRGLTPIGRVTILVLRINRSDAVAVRAALMEEGEYFT